MSHHYLPWLVGLAFSVFVGHFAVKNATQSMWRALGIDPETRPFRWQPQAVGLVERTLFTASIVGGHPEFIAVWLGVKTVGQWSSWGLKVAKERGLDQHEIFSVFILGQGLSIAFGAAGGYGITLLEAGKTTPAVLLGLATFVGTTALAIWIRRQPLGS